METKEKIAVLPRARVVHVTTSHYANDVRIFEKECRSLAASSLYDVFIAAHGHVDIASGVFHIPFSPPPRSRVRRFVVGPRRARALTQAIHADLWHLHDPELLPLGLRLARSGQRVVWDAHEDYVKQFDEAGAKSWIPWPMRQVVKAGTKLLLARIDQSASAIVAATPTIASRYKNPHIVVVGNEARLETFKNCAPSFESRRILFTGQPGPGHLFMEVVEAIASIEGAKLAVAGRPPDPSLWRAANLLLGDRLSHLGWLDRGGIADAFSHSAVGLLTYADLPTNAENSPNKHFEFGAAGLPVVATPTHSNRHRMAESNGGLLADGFTASDIADALTRLLTDRELWLAASIATRQWAVASGSWMRSEEQLLKLYGDLLITPRLQ